jgi:hypothetical protein
MNRSFFFMCLLLLLACLNASANEDSTRLRTVNDTIVAADSNTSSPAYSPDASNKSSTVKFYEKAENPFANTHQFFGFLILFILIIFIWLSNPEYFRRLFLSAFNRNFLLNNIYKRNFLQLINNLLLDLVFISIVTALLYRLFATNNFSFINAFGGLAVFILLQLGLNSISFRIFFNSPAVNLHVNNLLIFNRLLGLVLTPCVFIAFYLQENLQLISLISLLLFILAVLVFRLFRLFFLIKSSHHFNTIYIILYLCVFEISLYLFFIREFSWFINLKL